MKILDTGLLYRNPIPHVRSVHGYFPSVVSMDNGEMLATAVLGEAFEAPNLRTHVFLSTSKEPAECIIFFDNCKSTFGLN